MHENETAALRYSGEAAHEMPDPTAKLDRNNPRRKSRPPGPNDVKAPRDGPIASRLLAEILRSEGVVLRVEKVQWRPGSTPVVQIVVLILGKSENWFAAPGRAAIRLTECKAVAQALMQVAE